MASYVSKGDVIDYTPVSAVNAGDVVVIGTIVGVAPVAIAANKMGSVQVKGVHRMPKLSADEITAGAAVKYYATSGVVSTATGVACGVAVALAATGATTVDVKLG